MFLVSVSLESMSLLLAAASSCLMLSHPDERAYCLARKNQRATDCSAIVNADLRIRCRVELGQDKSQCVAVSNPGERALCASGGMKRE